MVVYELTGYNQPSVPEFLTEPTVQTSPNFELQWSEFAGAQHFQLLEDGVEIYGSDTQFQVRIGTMGRTNTKSTPSLNLIMSCRRYVGPCC